MKAKEKILNRCGKVICSWCKTKYNYEYWNKEKKCDECGQETLSVWVDDLTLSEFEQFGKEQFEAGARAQRDACIESIPVDSASSKINCIKARSYIIKTPLITEKEDE